MHREVLLHSADNILPRNLRGKRKCNLIFVELQQICSFAQKYFLGLDMDIITTSLWYISLLFILKLCLFGVFFENMFHPYLI